MKMFYSAKVTSVAVFDCCRYYKWILERNFHDLNKGVRGNQVRIYQMPF